MIVHFCRFKFGELVSTVDKHRKKPVSLAMAQHRRSSCVGGATLPKGLALAALLVLASTVTSAGSADIAGERGLSGTTRRLSPYPPVPRRALPAAYVCLDTNLALKRTRLVSQRRRGAVRTGTVQTASAAQLKCVHASARLTRSYTDSYTCTNPCLLVSRPFAGVHCPVEGHML
jgi:hypothetical protein